MNKDETQVSFVVAPRSTRSADEEELRAKIRVIASEKGEALAALALCPGTAIAGTRCQQTGRFDRVLLMVVANGSDIMLEDGSDDHDI
jgi:hypothetical protein